jgi:hypothetical protein
MGVLRPPCTLALRRLGLLLAAGSILVLASIAAAKAPDGGHGQASLWDRMGGRATGIAPLRWLRASSRSFQTLMRMLAERSVEVPGATPPGPVYPRDEHETEERDEHEGDGPPTCPSPMIAGRGHRPRWAARPGPAPTGRRQNRRLAPAPAAGMRNGRSADEGEG